MPEVAELEKVATFKPGFWKGRYYTPEFVRALYDNFQRFSTGDKPYYVPYLSINHKDEFRHGSINRAEIDKQGVLSLWAETTPSVGQMVKQGNIGERSVEFWEPKQVNGQWEGFYGPDGKLVNGPVIRCLSLLGNAAPAVKGLGPLPDPKFKDRPTAAKFSDRAISRFSDKVANVSQTIIDQLTKLGFDLSKLPPDATDELGQAIIDAIQNANANPSPAANPNANPAVPATMSAPAAGVTTTGTPAANPGGAGVTIPSIGGATPSAVTMKFMEEVNGQLVSFNTELTKFREMNAASVRAEQNRMNGVKEGVINRFLDEMGDAKACRILPAQRAGVKSLLMKCDYTSVRKFADNSGSGTELEEMMHNMRTTYPVVKTGGPKTQQPGVSQPGTAGTSRPEVVNRMLSGSVYGRRILADQKKK